MLKAAVEAARRAHLFDRPRVAEDILWLLQRVNEFAERRNDVVHSPFSIINPPNEVPYFDSMWFTGNPRATRLRNKDLLKEFKWYRNYAQTLADFAYAVFYARSSPYRPWPVRPLLPTQGQKKSRPTRNRLKPPK